MTVNIYIYIGQYYAKRFFRLVLPTWIFVTFYFLLNNIFEFQQLTERQILRTYLLQDASIGYVWIIYIYLICALLMPLLVHVDLRKLSHVVACILIFCLYLAIIDLSDSYLYRIFVLYPIIYGLISVIGVNFRRVDRRIWVAFGILCLAVFFAVAICLWQENGVFVRTGSEYKYPPRVYYLAYTIGCSLLLLSAAEKLKHRLKANRVVTFIGSSTLWLYLWHILGLQIAKRLTESEPVRMLIVILFSLAVVYVQSTIVAAIEKRTGKNRVLSLFKG